MKNLTIFLVFITLPAVAISQENTLIPNGGIMPGYNGYGQFIQNSGAIYQQLTPFDATSLSKPSETSMAELKAAREKEFKDDKNKYGPAIKKENDDRAKVGLDPLTPIQEIKLIRLHKVYDETKGNEGMPRLSRFLRNPDKYVVDNGWELLILSKKIKSQEVTIDVLREDQKDVFLNCEYAVVKNNEQVEDCKQARKELDNHVSAFQRNVMKNCSPNEKGEVSNLVECQKYSSSEKSKTKEMNKCDIVTDEYVLARGQRYIPDPSTNASLARKMKSIDAFIQENGLADQKNGDPASASGK